MAVEDKYVNSDLQSGNLTEAVKVGGAEPKFLMATFEVAAADDNDSVYRLFRVSPDQIPVRIDIIHDTITGASDYDLGLYEPGAGGAAKDADVLADGLDLSSGTSKDGMTTVDAADRLKKFYEHAGDAADAKLGAYDIALTANAVGSAAGTITVIAEFVQG